MTEHPILAARLPGMNADALGHVTQTYGPADAPVSIALPKLDAAAIAAVAASVKTATRRTLKTYPVARIVDTLDAAIARLLDRAHPIRRQMDRLLPRLTGYDADMVGLGLTRYLMTFRKPELLRFLAEDFPNPAILDGFQPLPKGGYGRAYGADLTAHIWAGNVPGLPLWSLAAGLLAKSGAVGKVPTAEPLFAGLFVDALAEVDPALAECIAVVWWQGGEEAPERALLEAAELALAYGGNAALAAIRARTPITTRFLAYGHKVSFAMIGREALDAAKTAETARAAAYDVMRYDQQGCFAPHVIFVEAGGRSSPERFAGHLAQELQAFERTYPRRALSLGEAADVAAWRAAAETSPGGAVIGDPAGLWTVAFDDGTDGQFSPSSLNRAIRVVAVQRLEDVAARVAPYRRLLQTAGLACAPDRLFALSAELGLAGVRRVAALGDMTAPEAGWHHDGRFNILDLVEITEIDGRALPTADRLAAYVD